jgi:signal peptidase I
MEPTLDVGQRVLVDRVIYHFRSPHIGDIVVFHPPEGAVGGGRECGVRPPAHAPCPKPTPQESGTNFIKRIVAGPGDRLRIVNGEPVVNGVKAHEGFINPCNGGGGCNFPKTITIPKGMYFMMGDNRGHSEDSRFFGPVPQSWFIGEAFFTYWPPDRIGFL